MVDRLRGRWLLPISVAVTAFTLDQISKQWVLDILGPEPNSRRIPLVGEWSNLVYVRNEGIAFGLFQNIPQFFTVTALIICGGAIYAYAYHLPNRSRWVQFSLGLVLGGAFGNIVDRVRYGYVVDFIQIGRWPVFNLADSAICVGVTMLAIYLLLNENAAVPQAAPRDDGLLRSLLGQDIQNDER